LSLDRLNSRAHTSARPYNVESETVWYVYDLEKMLGVIKKKFLKKEIMRTPLNTSSRNYYDKKFV